MPEKKSLASILSVFTQAVDDLRNLRDANDAEATQKQADASRLAQEANALTAEATVAHNHAKNIEKNILGVKNGWFS
jgi:hypothetical protein